MNTLNSLVDVDTQVTLMKVEEALDSILDNIRNTNDNPPLPGEWDDRLAKASEMVEDGFGLNEAESNFIYGLYLILNS